MTEGTAGALAGVRVIDLSSVIAAPQASQILGDYGADVIKVETPFGDETRRLGPPFVRDAAPHFMSANRNKRTLALDLSKPDGREVLLRLLEGADILLENFKAGTMEKWGLGYEQTLKARFPRLIHASLTGFGQTGPYAHFPGYDAMGQSFSGIASFNGDPDGGPTRVCVPLSDMSACFYVTIGMLVALQARERTGLGQAIDVGLVDSAMTLLLPYAPNWMYGGDDFRPKRRGSKNPVTAPHDIYPTADGHVFICVGNDTQFAILCDGLGHPEIAADPRFATHLERLKHVDALDALIKPILAETEAVKFSERMLAAGVPVGAVLEVPEAFAHKQAVAREMTLERDWYKGIGFPAKLSATPAALHRLPPAFGEHNDEILAEAGYEPDAIARLKADGIVAGEPRARRVE